MIEWDAARIAAAAGANPTRVGEGGPGPCDRLARGDNGVTCSSVCVESAWTGGAFAEQALRAGAWGVLVAPEHAQRLTGGTALSHPNPLAGMQSLAREWRVALGQAGAKVVGITGSTGKTSTKDILAALLRDARELAETGMSAAVPASPGFGGRRDGGERSEPQHRDRAAADGAGGAVGTKALVLEMAMRGSGQIAELTAIAQPEVGVIVNVGPVHLEQLGTIEAVAAAKAELIAGMAGGATVVVPAGEPLLEPHLRADQHTVTLRRGR